jgi:uncharacterized protein (TIGR02569 family)
MVNELVPESVRTAFGLTGDAVPQAGGQGASIRLAGAVLKPVHDATEEANWSAATADGLAPFAGFRVPRPLRTPDGRYVVDGWCGAEYLPAEPGPAGRWAELLAAGRAFHAALRDLPRPDFLSRRTHRWAVADRVAWGEIAWGERDSASRVEVRPELRPVLGSLVAARRPVGGPAQLVHGDLAGNVLFPVGEVGGAPVVIDFSPYWRPVGFAEAVVVVDGLLWYDAPDELIGWGAADPDWAQLLLRALIFRLVADGLVEEGAGPGRSVPAAVVRRYREVAAGLV